MSVLVVHVNTVEAVTIKSMDLPATVYLDSQVNFSTKGCNCIAMSGYCDDMLSVCLSVVCLSYVCHLRREFIVTR